MRTGKAKKRKINKIPFEAVDLEWPIPREARAVPPSQPSSPRREQQVQPQYRAVSPRVGV
jgi:hypothetical protein